MLRLSNTTLAALERNAQTLFIQKLEKHFLFFYPEDCAQLGSQGLRKRIERGMEKAGSYGIYLQPGICKFLTVMFELGENFDNDPSLPWVRAILNQGPPAPIDRLVAATCAYLQVQES